MSDGKQTHEQNDSPTRRSGIITGKRNLPVAPRNVVIEGEERQDALPAGLRDQKVSLHDLVHTNMSLCRNKYSVRNKVAVLTHFHSFVLKSNAADDVSHLLHLPGILYLVTSQLTLDIIYGSQSGLVN